MPSFTRLPGPLPWAALAPSLAAAEDRLARLDERLRGSPIRQGWIARTHFTDSCASLWLDGDMVPLEDLVLHDAHRDIHAPTRALIRAQAMLRARRRIAAADPSWALTPVGLDSLRGRAGEGDPDTEPAQHGDAPGLDGDLDAADGISGNGFLPADGGPEGRLAEAFAAVEAAVGRTTQRLAGDTARPERDPLVYDLEWNEESRLDDWRAAVVETAALPPVLAAALALDAWEQIAPLQHSPWLGRLLIPALLRGRGKTKAHLACLAIGLRAVPRDRRRAGDQTARLIAFVDALAAAAAAGLKEHERWAAARALLARKLTGRRATSRLPALVDYVMSRPIVSAGMIAAELRITPRAAQNLVADLGLREATGRGRYRAWGII
ncbi:MAG: RHE_PE00001 family protein [Methylocella sp.]